MQRKLRLFEMRHVQPEDTFSTNMIRFLSGMVFLCMVAYCFVHQAR
jgi:hypothetical protein